MKKVMAILILFAVSLGPAFAHSNYVGFSGAPTSDGTCTRSCHAQNSFIPTCEISGFPAVYEPDRQYIITVGHLGGLTIRQFNCSIRADADSSAAGTITAGDSTVLYSVPNETNGVHWTVTSLDSGTFVWTAPPMGTGPVTLYWAGLQGTHGNGAEQQIVLSVDEQTNDIDYSSDLPERFSLEQNYPNPFNASTKITFQISVPGPVVVDICTLLGNRVTSLVFPDASRGCHTLSWDGTDEHGSPLPSGLYFYQLRTGQGDLTRKMVLLR